MVGLVALAVAACSAAPATVAPTEAIATAEPTTIVEAVEPTTEPTLAPPADAEAPAMDLPTWASLPLTDVNTGETFALADYAGQTIYVHMMATWCTNCLASQRSLRDEVVPQIAGENVVFVSLDVQTQLDQQTLASYTSNNNFNWPFAVASQELLNAVVADYGRSATNPPSRPHFVIYPDGSTTGLLTGRTTPEEEIDIIRNMHGVGG